MHQTVYKVTHTRNEYGDYVASGETKLKCRFWEVNQIQITGNNEAIQSDAIMWLEPDIAVEEGDIFKFEGNHYRVEEVRKTKPLRRTALDFIKCRMTKYGAIS